MSAIGTRENPRGVILVQGTAGWNQRWWTAGSPFVRHLVEHGFEVLTGPNGMPFRWTTSLNGWRAWRRWFGMKDEKRDWICGGEALAYFLERVRLKRGIEHVQVVTHSHGIWVAMHAAGADSPIRCLMTIAPPGRVDMREVIEAARPHIGYWVLVIDRDTDVWASLGGIGDGHVGIDRAFSFLSPSARPDVTIMLPDIGHSKLLEESGAYLWDDNGLFDQLHLAGQMPEAHGV